MRETTIWLVRWLLGLPPAVERRTPTTLTSCGRWRWHCYAKDRKGRELWRWSWAGDPSTPLAERARAPSSAIGLSPDPIFKLA